MFVMKLLVIFHRYTVSLDNSDASVLRFRVNDGRGTPEPAYTETKASILRRYVLNLKHGQ